jgi:hypothetical protein
MTKRYVSLSTKLHCQCAQTSWHELGACCLKGDTCFVTPCNLRRLLGSSFPVGTGELNVCHSIREGHIRPHVRYISEAIARVFAILSCSGELLNSRMNLAIHDSTLHVHRRCSSNLLRCDGREPAPGYLPEQMAHQPALLMARGGQPTARQALSDASPQLLGGPWRPALPHVRAKSCVNSQRGLQENRGARRCSATRKIITTTTLCQVSNVECRMSNAE